MLDNALKLLKEFTEHSYKAYIVGGFVRDHILGIESNDIDITTNAIPKQIKELFEDSCLSKDLYGSVVVFKKGIRFDITTFREEIEYEDHRRPIVIQYIDDLYPDLLRRDFVINTLCMDDKGEIIDYFGGQQDIEDRIIRTVGDAYKKFSEDSLRILRAIRLATILDFNLAEEVKSAIHQTKGLVKELSYTRKKEEIDKIFNSTNRDKGIELLLEFGLDKELELENLDSILGKNVNTSIAIWNIVDPNHKYPYTKNELELMKNIEKAYNLNNTDPMTLYKYGLYVNSCVAMIKGIDLKIISEKYDGLIIKSRKDIDIDSESIMKLLNLAPGKYLKDIYDDIEREILYRRLENRRDCIDSYILNHYGKGE